MKDIRILIGSDLCPTQQDQSFFRSGDIRELFGDSIPYFQRADLRIANLECPLVEKPHPILKTGPNMSCHPDCLQGMKEIGIDLLCLANNHMMDHGAAGLNCTLRNCERLGVATVGAGPNLSAAKRPFIRTINGIRLGVLAMAEHEWGIATESSPGVNPLDPIEYTRFVKRERSALDVLIVVLHAGNEHYPYPSPRLSDIAHFLIEGGAHVVVVQHTHCPGCIESYLDGTIVYGQGNLIFHRTAKNPDWYKGFLLEIKARADGSTRTQCIPYTQSWGHCGVRRMEGKEEEEFLEEIHSRSLQIGDPHFLMEKWKVFCEQRETGYLNELLGYKRIRARLNKYFGLAKRYSSKKRMAILCNIIRCESHREAVVAILENILSQKRDRLMP